MQGLKRVCHLFLETLQLKSKPICKGKRLCHLFLVTLQNPKSLSHQWQSRNYGHILLKGAILVQGNYS